MVERKTKIEREQKQGGPNKQRGTRPESLKKSRASKPKSAKMVKKSKKRSSVRQGRKKQTQKAPQERRFALMDLSDVMIGALDSAGYFEPTDIQAGLIPRAMEGVDVMGQARTGTGKTAAFAIPILERLNRHAPMSKGTGPRALVLVPTRELAVQVRDEIEKLALGRNLRIAALYGGKPIRSQTEKLKHGVDIAVGTPGRIIDHMDRASLMTGDFSVVVLDEADRMLDIGFRPDIEKILRRCPQSRQTLLLSATLPSSVMRLAQRYMHDPEVLNFSPKDISADAIEQFYCTVDSKNKFELLVRLLKRENPAQAIIFCRTRRGTDRIASRLSKFFKGAACIHGDLPQRTRDRVMARFRDGKTKLLVATDVVGRGIDVTGISHIINFDIPEFCDDYVHRVGRTGRMGQEGVAYTFVTPEEGGELTRIEIRINMLLKRDEINGFATFDTQADEEKISPEAKPVFGRPKRRVRRAL